MPTIRKFELCHVVLAGASDFRYRHAALLVIAKSSAKLICHHKTKCFQFMNDRLLSRWQVLQFTSRRETNRAPYDASSSA